MHKCIKNIFRIVIIFFIITLTFFSCKKINKDKIEKSDYIFEAPISKEPLPSDLEWITNDSDPVFASPDAKKGGIIKTFILSFPNTFRLVGPDSNDSFANYIDANNLGLVSLHPNTENIMPSLAEYWAYGSDNKTMYYKLNKSARWSDGVPVTAHDFAYTLEFMRSKYIQQPYYNEVYAEDKMEVIVYDDYTLAVVNKDSEVPKEDLFFYTNLTPVPRHYFGKLDDTFVEKYNWKIVPNTGPYQIKDFEKGKYVTFERIKDWWAKDLRYFKNRFNVNRVIFKVVRDNNIAWEYFKKNEIDVFPITPPEYWHEKTRESIFQNGYVDKIWFYNDMRQSPVGFFLNTDADIFKDINVRYAFAYAMNFEKVNDKILRNEYYRLEHAYVGYGEFSNNKIRARRFDIEKVKYYMEKSGWKRGSDGIWKKNGKKFSVTLTYSGDLQTPRLVVLKEEAKKAGVDLILEILDGTAHYKKTMEKKHEITYMAWTTKYRPTFFQQYLSEYAHKPQTVNITNTDNTELDNLINDYRFSLDQSKKIKLALEIEEKLHELCVFIPAFMVPYVRQAYWRWWKLPDIHGTKSTDSVFEPFDSSTGGLFWYDEKVHKETLNAMKKGIKFDPVTITDDTYMMDIIKEK